MKNSTTALIIGYLFLIASFFNSDGVTLICASIFFSAYFIIESMEKNKNKHDIIKSKVWLLYESYFSHLKLGHSKKIAVDI